jgi:hypothetical protein
MLPSEYSVPIFLKSVSYMVFASTQSQTESLYSYEYRVLYS